MDNKNKTSATNRIAWAYLNGENEITLNVTEMCEVLHVCEDISKAKKLVKAVEPKRGEWSEHRRYELTPSLNGHMCSACGCVEQKITDFCPNCGADMRKDEHGR